MTVIEDDRQAGALDAEEQTVEEAEAQPSLERALAQTEADLERALKAAATVTGSLRRLRAAAHVGDLRSLKSTMGAAEQTIAALQEEFAAAKAGWTLDEDAYFADGAFPRELLETAASMNVQIYEQDDRLYSYPSLVRVLPSERAVLIDKARERRLRPTVLVSHLQDLQKRPARFKPEAFLEALFNAYVPIVQKRGDDRLGSGTVVRLLDIYDLLTLLPGQAREYSRQEFARDIYLLDQSGVTATRRGYRVSFPASTGTRLPSGTVRVITQHGEEKVYYGIAFTGPES
jgi:hypothetical protein